MVCQIVAFHVVDATGMGQLKAQIGYITSFHIWKIFFLYIGRTAKQIGFYSSFSFIASAQIDAVQEFSSDLASYVISKSINVSPLLP